MCLRHRVPGDTVGHCALLSRTFLRCCPYVSSVTCRYLGEYVSVLHRWCHCHWRERASSDFNGTQLFTQLDSRSWSETSRRLWLGQPEVDSASATFGFDGSRRVSPVCNTKGVYLCASNSHRAGVVLQGSSCHLTPGRTCSTTLCLERERFLRREFCSRQGSADHESVFVVFLFGRMRGGVVLGILMRWC